MVDVTIAKQTEGKCRIEAFPDHLAYLNYGIAVQKNSGIESIVSDVIHKLNEDGTLRKMYQKWVQTTCLEHIESSEYKPSHLSTDFFIVTITIAFSIIILAVEWIVYTLCMRRKGLKLNPKERP